MTNDVLTVDRPGRFEGMHNGTLIVAEGIDLEIAGMVNGAVVVGSGATVLVSGMVNGAMVNNGGRITTTGMVNP